MRHRVTAAIGLASILSLTPITASAAELTVKVTNVRSSDGVLTIALCDNEKCWEDHKSHAFVAELPMPANQEGVTFEIPDLPAGAYGIMMHHDEDGDGRVNRAFFGTLPTEGFGFSRVRGMVWSKPSFNEVRFDVPEGASEIELEVFYIIE